MPSLRALTGLRYVAALHVLLFHFASATVAPGSVFGNIVHSGYVGVNFFFILSGLLLAYNYIDAQGALRMKRAEFYAARLSRIYPVYAASLVIALPGFIANGGEADNSTALLRVIAALLVTATLLQSWYYRTAFVLNSPAWSLSVEAFLYATFPWLAPRCARFADLRRALPLVLGLWIVSVSVGATYDYFIHHADFDSGLIRDAERILRTFPPFHIFSFAIGIISGVWLARDTTTPSVMAEVVALSALGVVILILGSIGGIGLWVPYLHQGLLAPAFVLLMIGFARGRGPVSWLLATPFMVLLGEASYALYLIHLPIGNALVNLASRWNLETSWMLTPLVAVSCTLAAIVLHLGIERPLRRPTRELALRGWRSLCSSVKGRRPTRAIP